jgi:hypothetical protein
MIERVYINSELSENFRNLKCGIVDYVDVYRIEGDKVFFKAGTGKFHLTKDELKEARLES